MRGDGGVGLLARVGGVRGGGGGLRGRRVARVRGGRDVRWGVVFGQEARFVVRREEEDGGRGEEGEVGGHGWLGKRGEERVRRWS